jgi:hypothetical protein
MSERTCVESGGGGVVGRQRQMERLGCQMICLKWRHLRREERRRRISDDTAEVSLVLN